MPFASSWPSNQKNRHRFCPSATRRVNAHRKPLFPPSPNNGRISSGKNENKKRRHTDSSSTENKGGEEKEEKKKEERKKQEAKRDIEARSPGDQREAGVYMREKAAATAESTCENAWKRPRALTRPYRGKYFILLCLVYPRII